jgi:acyl-CoA synthetase (AMP-forming)/AMP-acid ligase II
VNLGRAVAGLFRAQADRALLVELSTGRRFTYAELDALARRAAGLLLRAGGGPGQRVALLLENSAEFAALYFGCLLTGTVAVPVNPLLHPSEVAFIVDHAGLGGLIYSPATSKLLTAEPSCPRHCLLPQQERGAGAGGIDLDDVPPAEGLSYESIDAGSLFSITFTSGTSALPKGVCHRVGSLLDNARTFNESLGLGPETRMLHVMTMGYMAGFLNTLLGPFMAGGTVVLAAAFNSRTPLAFWSGAREHGVNSVWLSPTMAAALVALDRDEPGRAYAREHLRVVCVGTAPLGGKIKQDFEDKYQVQLLESYGLSELLFVASNRPQLPQRRGSVGQLLPGVAVRILDDHGQPAVESGGTEGEIFVQTPQQMAGYLDYETSRPAPLPAGAWFATGDVGSVDSDGYLYITGRKKDLIIRGGTNISPRAIEEVLLGHEAVEQVAVVGVPHPFYGEAVVAAVILRPGRSLADEQASLRGLCEGRLSAGAVPARFVRVDSLPLSANGKVQKNVLRDRLLKQG